MVLENSTQNRSKLISYVILIGDLILLNSLMMVIVGFWPEIKPDNLSWQGLFLLGSMAYLLTAGSGSVILHHRKVHAYQIVSRVFHNVLLYVFICFLIVFPDCCLDMVLIPYAVFLSVALVVLSFYRLGCRYLVKMWRRSGMNLKHLVLVGSDSAMVELYHALTVDRSSGYTVHGYFADAPETAFPADCPYLGTPEQVISWLEDHSFVQQLYCNLPVSKKELMLPLISYCENHLVHFFSLTNLHNYLHHEVYLDHVESVPFFSLRNDPLQRVENRFVKRSFDLLVSALFLGTLFPIIALVVAVITKLTMPGPVFFRQKRNGLNDKEFYCYKFRSMKVNAEADILQATQDDPRKTRWGNFMRKTSIDELPQFFNVLRGEMSIVGPRPHMVKHTQEYSQLIDRYMVRHFVKPGITGWSQVTGFRGETKTLEEMEGRIKGDIWYIEHWNSWLDFYIIYKTVANAISGESKAY